MEPTRCQETGHDPTVGVICPLSVELQAVLDIFDVWKRLEIDDVHYYVGSVGGLCTVAVPLPSDNYGPRFATSRAIELNKTFPGLKHRFLVGVAGGIPSKKADIRLGDVVIATRICSNDLGKYNIEGLDLQAEVQHTPEIITSLLPGLPANSILDHDLEMMKHRADRWARPVELLDVLYEPTYHCQSSEERDCLSCEQSHQVTRPERATMSPQLHHGLIASGGFVLKNGQFREDLRNKILSKTQKPPLAIEMEAVGLKGFIIVRGICDYADSHKHKRWQEYAAATAAACFKVLLRHLGAYKRPPSSRDTRQTPTTIECQRSATTQSERLPEDSLSPQRIEPECSTAQRKLEDTATNISESNSSPNVDHCANVDIGREVATVKLSGYDVTIKDLPITLRSTDLEGMTAVVHLTELRATNHFETSRRLVIDSQGPHPCQMILWLPLDSVRTEINAAKLKLTFSDCRVRQPSSLDGTKSYSCLYDATNPNTTIVLSMLDTSSALSFRDKILHRDSFLSYERCSSSNELEVKFNTQSSFQSRQIQVWPVGRSLSEPRTKQGFTIIATELGTESAAAIFYGSHHLNFDITWPDIGIRLWELQRTDYEVNTKHSPVWPPAWLDQSAGGGAPKAIKLEQGHGIEIQSSAADMVLFKEFLKALTGWDFQFCGSATYAVKTVKGSTGVKKCRAGISVWSRGEELRIHCRNHQENFWVSTSLTKLPFPPVVSGFPRPTLIRDTNKAVVKLSDVVHCKGPYILISTFAADKEVGSASQGQDFEFEKAEYAEDFIEALAQHVVEPRLEGQRLSLSSDPLSKSGLVKERRRSH